MISLNMLLFACCRIQTATNLYHYGRAQLVHRRRFKRKVRDHLRLVAAQPHKWQLIAKIRRVLWIGAIRKLKSSIIFEDDEIRPDVRLVDWSRIVNFAVVCKGKKK